MSTWWAVAALAYYEDGEEQLSIPTDLGNGVRLDRMPEWAKSKVVLEDVDAATRDRVKDGSAFALIYEYEADGLGSPDPEWRGSERRSMQDKATEIVTLAAIAMWLARAAILQLAMIAHFHRPERPDRMQRLVVPNGPIVHEWDAENRLTMDDLGLARRLNEQFLRIDRHGTTAVTLRLLIASLNERVWETRFIQSWIAMESLFGSTQPQETRFRLSQRVAFFLAGSEAEARELFRRARDGYDWRSKVVHGRRGFAELTDTKSLELSHQVQEFLRLALVRILNDSALLAKFDGSHRDEFLDNLAFSVRWRVSEAQGC